MILPTLETISLAFAYCYLMVGFIMFLRRAQTNRLVSWGLGYMAASALWQWSTVWSEPTAVGAGLIETGTFVLMTLCAYLLLYTSAAYLEQSLPRWVGLVGLGSVAAIIGVNQLLPLFEFNAVPFLRFRLLGGNLIALISVFILAATAYSWTLNEYRRTPFPWHANRNLFWSYAVLLLLIGEILFLIDNPLIIVAGYLLRLSAAVALAYGVVTYVRFDVRTRFRRWLTGLLLFAIALLPAVALYFLILMIQPAYSPVIAAVLSIGGMGLVLVLFAPYYRRLERLIYRYLIGEAFKESQALRDYNQAISDALEIESLATAIFDQLNHLFEVSRGALVLATREGNEIIFEPIPAAGDLSREPQSFPQENPFVDLLIKTPQPLLQYELDYNPVYAPAKEESQSWLKGLAMEIYAPIRSGTDLKGFIALGAKRSGYTYRANELDLIQLLADQTLAALDNATLYRELGDQNEKVRLLNANLLRQNERLETMDKVKSDFITIASHELRTPLTQVKGYTDILASLNEENALTRDQTRQIINQIERAVENLEQLISAMLDASQIDVDEMKMNFTKTEIRSALRLAQEPLLQAMKQRRIQMQVHCDDDLPAIQADFKRLVQAFTNILGNAVKYTPDNGRITIGCRKLDEPQPPTNSSEQPLPCHQYVEISITDTGIGIDSAYHQLIFEKFFRLGDPHLHSTGSTKFMGAGPGLGLTIARGVILGHGGRIWVESAGEDRDRLPGSTFTIILPVQPQVKPAEVAKDTPDTSPEELPDRQPEVIVTP